MYLITIICALFLLFSMGCENSNEKQIDDEAGKINEALSLNDKFPSLIDISYAILGNVSVNTATTINIIIDSKSYKDEITLSYRIGVPDDLIFGENQLQSMALRISSNGLYPDQQVTVIPKREGRLFLIVSIDIIKNSEIITKSTAIPIDVEKSQNK